MSYRINIKLSSEANVRHFSFTLRPVLLGGLASLIAIGLGSGFYSENQPEISAKVLTQTPFVLSITHPAETEEPPVTVVEVEESSAENNLEIIQQAAVEDSEIMAISGRSNETELTEAVEFKDQSKLLNEGVLTASEEQLDTVEKINWQTVKVKRGENLSIIFDRLSISPTDLHNIMVLGKETAILKKIMPGQEIRFAFKDDQFHGLEYEYDLTHSLTVQRDGKSFIAKQLESELEKRSVYASSKITSSLFLAGQGAGITDNVIMNLVSIYGWDIDFALDIRSGDSFSILYEEHFKDGKKVANGPILAAEFINQGKVFHAVRYIHDDGKSGYYSDTGHNMRKAFLRTPVNFSRISSRFNLRRKHPVLNRIRAHRGVDYAASSGTPIKAAGDGSVVYKGRKGGYGRTVILKHGSQYSTLYAHMSRYGKGLRNGKRVKQGQTIGYVGSSGLATGPHLHYEFRINGVHRNPLKVKFPKALRIPDKIMADFTHQTQPLLAQLQQYKTTVLASRTNTKNPPENSILAMSEETDPLSLTR